MPYPSQDDRREAASDSPLKKEGHVATEGGTLLVPLDGSTLAEEAIPYASAVAGSGGQLHLVQVTPDPEPVPGPLGQVTATETATQADVESAYLESARQGLRQAADRWQAVAPRVEVEVVSGDTAEVILRVAG